MVSVLTNIVSVQCYLGQDVLLFLLPVLCLELVYLC